MRKGLVRWLIVSLGSASAVSSAAEADDGVCPAKSGSGADITWNPAHNSTTADIVRGESVRGTGPYGCEGVGGVPTTPQVTTTCP